MKTIIIFSQLTKDCNTAPESESANRPNSANQNQPNLTSLKEAKKGTLQKSPQAAFYSNLPQISSTPGISPKQPNRYRVVVDDEVLGDRLTAEEAILLARSRRRKSLTPCLELLEKHGIEGDTAIFLLSAVGGEA